MHVHIDLKMRTQLRRLELHEMIHVIRFLLTKEEIITHAANWATNGTST